MRFPATALSDTNAEAGPSRPQSFGRPEHGQQDGEAEEETYQLLELPAEIVKRVEACPKGVSFP